MGIAFGQRVGNYFVQLHFPKPVLCSSEAQLTSIILALEKSRTLNISLEEALLQLIQAGLVDSSIFRADPVNTSTGNFIDSKADLTIDGRYPLELRRFYNSIQHCTEPCCALL